MTSVQATVTVDVPLSDQCQEIRSAVMFPDESINDVSAEGKDSIVEDMMAPQCTMRLPMSIGISEVLKCKHSFHAHFK